MEPGISSLIILFLIFIGVLYIAKSMEWYHKASKLDSQAYSEYYVPNLEEMQQMWTKNNYIEAVNYTLTLFKHSGRFFGLIGALTVKFSFFLVGKKYKYQK